MLIFTAKKGFVLQNKTTKNKTKTRTIKLHENGISHLS